MKLPVIRRTQSGFMLIESLVALLLFSIGIIGLIGMQATAARIAADSQYRAEASMHADQLIAQMRSGNRTTLAADFATGGDRYNAWLNLLNDPETGLPGASDNPPTVTVVGTPPTVTITVFWKAPGEAARHQFITVATIN